MPSSESFPPLPPDILTLEDLYAFDPDILTRDQEQRLQRAVQLFENGSKVSIRAMATALSLNRNTIGNRVKGGLT
ncbi:hypothetical protein H0H92_000971, partial [Tricholoma furcatifolium]